MKKYSSWWEEFKDSDWFERILLLFPWLLILMVIVIFIPEFMKYGTV
jgi:hypothetical protein